MFHHNHSARCEECRMHSDGKYLEGYNQGKQQGRLNYLEHTQDLEKSVEELRKARLKIDVYERMFSALRIPVLPKEGA